MNNTQSLRSFISTHIYSMTLMHDHESDLSTSSLWVRQRSRYIKQYKTYNSEGLLKFSKRANECSTTKDNDPECSNDSSRTATDRQGAVDNESNCRFIPRTNYYTFLKKNLLNLIYFFSVRKSWSLTQVIVDNDKYYLAYLHYFNMRFTLHNFHQLQVYPLFIYNI